MNSLQLFIDRTVDTPIATAALLKDEDRFPKVKERAANDNSINPTSYIEHLLKR